MTQSPYSHYSPYRSKSAEGDFNPNEILGMGGIGGGLAGGLGGAGIGALIQALRGKSIGKGALIGGGIGGVAGAGLGLAGGQMYNKNKEIERGNKEIASLSDALDLIKNNPFAAYTTPFMGVATPDTAHSIGLSRANAKQPYLNDVAEFYGPTAKSVSDYFTNFYGPLFGSR